MPVEPFESNKSCYVCSESPVLLEINTNRSKLKEVVEKIIKAKLRTNLPLIMNASNLLYEAGDIEDDMVAIYDANLEKILVVFSFSCKWWYNAYSGGFSTEIEM